MMRRFMLVAAMAVSVAACGDDGTSPNEGGSGSLQLRFSQTASASTEFTQGATIDDVPLPAVVRNQVSSVEVTLTAVHALRIGANEEQDASWVPIPIAPAQTLDLLDLPTSVDNAVLLPRGELEAGRYQNIRLIVEDATITFNTPVTVGQRTWAANEPHPLRIPGPNQTRLKVPTASFEIGDDDDDEATFIDLVFNPGTSVQTIAATPNFILMAPVLLATPRR